MGIKDYELSSSSDLLAAVLDDDRLKSDEREAFGDMLRRQQRSEIDQDRGGVTLTPKQRSWLEAVASRLDIAPPAANLASRVPVGRPVAAMDAFLASPKPVRR